MSLTDTAERNRMLAKAVIAAERKGIAAAVSAVSGLLEAVPSAARRLRDLRAGTTPPRPAPRSTTILDPELREVGLHLQSAKRKLTVGEAELRTAHLSIFRWLAGRAQERRLPMMYTLHLGQQLKFRCNARPHRILAADFSILVSAFEFPSGAGIWDASHFRFLDSRCKSRVGDGQEMTSFPVSDSDFPILGANPGSVKGRRLHHSRFRILISRFPVQNRPSPHGVSGEFISRFLIPLSIGT